MIYSSVAKIYDFVILGLIGHRKAAAFYVCQLPFDENKVLRILDAGCGTGLYTFALLGRFPNARVVAFDLNQEMLKQMQANLEKAGLSQSVRTFIADIISPLPETDKEFDLIVTGGVLEHVKIEEAVRNLSPYLKVDGYFLNAAVRDNVLGKLLGKIWGFRTYSKRENTEAFLSNGFALANFIRLPLRYFFIRLAKEAYLFKKVSRQ